MEHLELYAQDLQFRPPLSHRTLLQGVSLRLQPGQVQWVAGATGSGKTLALKLLSGLLGQGFREALSGTLQFQGRSIAAWSLPDWRRSIVYLAPQPHLLGLTVAENLAYPLQLCQCDKTTQIDRQDEVLALLHLPSAILGATAPLLSRQQQQRVALARALMLHPAVLVLDNPTQGWPLEEAERLWHCLQPWLQTGRLGLLWATDHWLDPWDDAWNKSWNESWNESWNDRGAELLPSDSPSSEQLSTVIPPAVSIALLDQGHWRPVSFSHASPPDIPTWLQAQQAQVAAEWGEWDD
ncbi:MAG: ATP-binding cassette domain-containing protein [Prochlorothrix sp.]|nr:ATP-binding cassette domain-containing protein [Prochlorothrix sp.]